jgi:hypothetical protein
LGKFGDLLIEYGTAAVLKGKLDLATLIPGAGILAGGAAIAAGIALKLAAGAFSGLIKGGKSGNGDSGSVPFAKGGIVFGPTEAIVGEYSGARSNPEIIAPLSDLKGMLSDMGGTSSFPSFIELRASGDSLAAVIDSRNKRNYRTN